MKARSLISVADLTPDELQGLFALTARVKSEPERYRSRLSGKSLGLIFEKSSTRTRVSFEVGMFQLGGMGLFLSSRDLQLGRGEAISDTAQVLSRYVDGIMARTFAHQTIVDLAKYATIPVINGLSDDLHPCQALADFFTLKEVFGDLMGRKLAYIGDGNNVAHSLMITAPMVGMVLTTQSTILSEGLSMTNLDLFSEPPPLAATCTSRVSPSITSIWMTAGVLSLVLRRAPAGSSRIEARSTLSGWV